jgi:uncharacterized membrane protein
MSGAGSGADDAASGGQPGQSGSDAASGAEPAPTEEGARSGLPEAAAPNRWDRWLAAHPRLRKWLPFITFIAGFVWDSLTLNRIDYLFDNFVLAGHLAAFAVMIVLVLRAQARVLRRPGLRRFERHFRWVMQFFLGGLLAKYVLFYFKSASFTRTSLFLLLLVVLLVGNEFLEHRLENAKLLAVLFFFCLDSFLAFFLPVIASRVETGLWVFAGLVSLVASTALFAVAIPRRTGVWGREFRAAAGLIAGAWLLLNVLYFANLIPPVPLALRSAGVFHRVVHTAAGYEVTYVQEPRYRFWKRWEDPFQLAQGESVYCYSAVFAPRGVRIPVRHRWLRHDSAGGWVTTDTIAFQVAGGREGGFRGYTQKRTVAPGAWRVELEAGDGRILGRIDFTVVAAEANRPALVTRLIP